MSFLNVEIGRTGFISLDRTCILSSHVFSTNNTSHIDKMPV